MRVTSSHIFYIYYINNKLKIFHHNFSSETTTSKQIKLFFYCKLRLVWWRGREKLDKKKIMARRRASANAKNTLIYTKRCKTLDSRDRFSKCEQMGAPEINRYPFHLSSLRRRGVRFPAPILQFRRSCPKVSERKARLVPRTNGG